MSASDDLKPNENNELSKGPISYMARHPVASNLIMVGLIVGGGLIGMGIKQEVFPEFTAELVTVRVPYPASSPEIVERGIVQAVEEGVQGLDGTKKVSAAASEGIATVYIELLDSADPNKALADIKNAVDRLRNLPQEAEDPEVSLVTTRQQVISVALYGDIPEHTLKELGEQARRDLLRLDAITQVEFTAVRPPEIAIEVSQDRLRQLGLTLDQIAREVSGASVEIPAGGVKTEAGETLVRVNERRDRGQEYENIDIVARPDGTSLPLGAVADIRDGFEDTDQNATFNGKPAILIEVYRTGDETPIEVADAVKEYVESMREKLPPTIGIATWRDQSQVLRERIDLLMRNAWMGLVLVMVILGLFLEIRLAFWVTMGIPISFFGAFLLMPAWGVSINMITLFAFIVTLGMVVDDAIVVGENIYFKRQQGLGPMEAAIAATKEVAAPITFAILTSIAAFSPMMFVPGFSGKLFFSIPAIVISVLLLSLFESMFVLPAHLGHLKDATGRGLFSFIRRGQRKFSDGFEWLVDKAFRPLLKSALHFRYTTVAVSFGMLAIAISIKMGGFIGFEFLPSIDSDTVAVSVRMPFGVDVDETNEVRDHLVKTAYETIDHFGNRDDILVAMYANVGSPLPAGGPVPLGGGERGGHLLYVMVQMSSSDKRTFSATEFVREWRTRAGDIPGPEVVAFNSSVGGPSSGAKIDVQLSHPDLDVLEAAASDLAATLSTYAGVKDVDNGFSPGKQQLDLALKPSARAYGLTAQALAQQVRNSFYGSEAIRLQRERDEVKVRVRLPERERESEYDIESLIIRVPGGGEMTLAEAAFIERGTAYTTIDRSNGVRTVNVTSDVQDGTSNPNEIMASLQKKHLGPLMEKYPGLAWSVEGERKEQAESLQSLGIGFAFALLVIYGLLAIPFRSYIQPLVVMAAIPFGVVGAIIGHLLMGYDLSVISVMGIVALAGIVVNDSLVLVDAINRYRKEMPVFEAVMEGGVRRLRPILLTSLTTFFGLAPMIFETSMQARFLIPMALSLGFGVLFATGILLFLVPSLYLIVEDVQSLPGRLRGAMRRQPKPKEKSGSDLLLG